MRHNQESRLIKNAGSLLFIAALSPHIYHLRPIALAPSRRRGGVQMWNINGRNQINCSSRSTLISNMIFTDPSGFLWFLGFLPAETLGVRSPNVKLRLETEVKRPGKKKKSINGLSINQQVWVGPLWACWWFHVNQRQQSAHFWNHMEAYQSLEVNGGLISKPQSGGRVRFT